MRVHCRNLRLDPDSRIELTRWVSRHSLLIGLGLFGVIAPRLAAVMHNLGTVLVTANSVKGLLPESDGGGIIEMPAEGGEVEDIADAAARAGTA